MGKLKKHEEIKQYILQGIHSGAMIPGDRIPTEAELMERFSVSRNPVRRALADLSDEGYLFKIHGSGSFVQEKALTEEVNIYVILFYNRYLESQIIHGMRKAVENCFYKNINLILKRPGRSADVYTEVLDSLGDREKCGILSIPLIDRQASFNKLLESSLRKLEKSSVPVVQIDRSVPGFGGSCVMSDHKMGAARMARLIFDKGHRSIAVFHDTLVIPSLKLRIEGIEQVCREMSGKGIHPYFYPLDYNRVGHMGKALLEDLNRKGVTALFCLTSELAFEMHSLLTAEGLNIPDDMSLCSFDDHCFLVEGIDNDVTAVLQPFEDLGYYSVNILLDQILGRSSCQATLLLEPEIVQRKSLASLQNVRPTDGQR